MTELIVEVDASNRDAKGLKAEDSRYGQPTLKVHFSS